MRIGMIGLGRMGMNMARRLLRGKHRVVGYNRSPGKVDEVVKEGASGAYSVEELVGKLKPPRVVWIMLPAGKAVEEIIGTLAGLLEKGDIIVEGGNSYYKDDIRHAGELKPLGVKYLDAGVSGGIWGLEVGYCLMLGGDESAYKKIIPLLRTLAPKDGYLYCGPAGAGHFVKMVHNGIEYGMMAAYGEGFEILDSSPYAGAFDYEKIAHLWNQGSVIRSWLLELAESAFGKDASLSKLQAYVEDSGEGRWTVQQAVESAVPAPVITASLYQRFRSRDENSFSDRLLAALRDEFGGHGFKTRERGKKKKKGG
jgi:6-phosphogluconate dehydrogenase